MLHRTVTAAGLGFLVVTGGAVLANAWILRRAAPFLVQSVDAAPHRAIAIVPGARVLPDGSPSDALEDRLATALDLFRAGRVDRVLVSGRVAADEDEVAAMSRWLLDRGLPPECLDRDPNGDRTLLTFENAARTFGVKDALVCTQRFHLSRAVFLARDLGIDAVGVPADRRPYRRAALDAAREVVARSRAAVDRILFARW